MIDEKRFGSCKLTVRKIGPVELTDSEIEEMYKKKLYVVSYCTVYMIQYNKKSGRYKGVPVYRLQDRSHGGITKIGRWFAMPYERVCHLLDTEDIPMYEFEGGPAA